MMLKAAVPEIHVSKSVAAKHFYSDKLGLYCVRSWRPDETNDDPCYITFVRESAWLQITSFEDGALGTSVYIYVDDVDTLHEEFVAKGIQHVGRSSESNVGNARVWSHRSRSQQAQVRTTNRVQRSN
jgi:predicted enzyme related to lactoylglutathione lyase